MQRIHFTVRSYSLHTAMTAFLAVISLMPIQSMAQGLNLDFEEKSSLTTLTNQDWVILKETATNALENSPDGSIHRWGNEQSGHSGVVTILSTDENSTLPCRDAKFFNTAKSTSSSTTVTVCKQDDGTWSAKGPSNTISNKASTNTFSQSDTSTEMKRKTLGQTSDYCRQLFQDIERLKGRPLQRSAAMERHKAECQR